MLFKRKIYIVLSLLFCAVIALVTANSNALSPVSAKHYAKPQIILDAGHGGIDGGAVAKDGTVEKDINLSISQALERMLKSSGFEVIMTRSADISTDDSTAENNKFHKKGDLQNRLALMDKYPDSLFVSIHLNKFTTSAASGSQVFYSGNTEQSKQLGEYIQSSIIKLLQPANTRVNKKATSSTYILYNATVPAVLVECGFLSNGAELENLKNEEYQQKMAFCIYCGIKEFFTNMKEI